MPGIEDWSTSPLTFVKQAFDSHLKDGSEWPKNLNDFFTEKLQETRQIPSLNETPNHNLVDGQIVKFRCMIQDMFDPEFYMDKYAIKNLQNGETRFSTCRFQETVEFGPKEEPIQDLDTIKHGERVSFYCVSIPGEAPWVREIYKKNEPSICFPSTSEISRSKRSREDDDELEEMNTDEIPEKNNSECMEVSESQKKSKPEENEKKSAENQKNSDIGLNFPIAKEKGQAAIVKIYDVKEETFKLNEIVEFVGIVSLSPLLAQNVEENSEDISAQFNKPEIEAKNPPASLIPRLHVLKYEKLSHNNPQISAENSNPVWEELRRSRDDLHSFLTQLLSGDSVTAEYLICHLISQVYIRKDSMSLGKFSLNIFGISDEKFTRKFATVLQLLLTKSHFLPLTIENLNNLTMIPKKDYASNRLVSGLLQLSKGTHLICDETQLSNGQLNQQGIGNLTSLGHMIKFQNVDYDFGFHKLNFETDLPTLVLSEGRSMLPQDVQIMLKPKNSEENFKNFDIDLIIRLRNYLTLAKMQVFELTQEAQNFVQEDFVQERQNQNSSIKTSDDLHTLLVFARLMALSRGEKSLNSSIWNEAKNLENERKQRSAHLPNRPVSQM